MYISSLRSYIEAVGGRLKIVAEFPEGEVSITNFSDVGADDDSRREWLIAPRNGLLTSEFASAMDVTVSEIRAAIRCGELPGVRLRVHGKVYAYAATVDDVAAYYELTDTVVKRLRSFTTSDVGARFAGVGTSLIDQAGRMEILTEFESRQEFEDANADESSSG